MTNRDKLTRLYPGTFLGQPYSRHIIGQKKTTIDFSKVLANGEVIFLKLSASLPADIKKFIGTIVISELLHAVRHRPPEKRGLFNVFIDEFQNFANSDDLATFMTEARKFGIATTIAHQERFGQLGDNKKMLGATLAAANQVFFQLTVKDAEELALEFAKAPPVEIRLEEPYAISQNPVSDLLRQGRHTDPDIRQLVDDQLRPLQQRIEAIRDEMEGERLIRANFLDQAALERIDERISWVEARGRTTENILGRAAAATRLAQFQTAKRRSILEIGKNLKQAVRDMNRFLIAVMEGETAKGRENFSDSLIGWILAAFGIPERERQLMALSISLGYGDQEAPRGVP